MPIKNPPKTKTDIKMPKPDMPKPKKITTYKEPRKSNKKVKF